MMTKRQTIGVLMMLLFASMPYLVLGVFFICYFENDDFMKWVFLGLLIFGLLCMIFAPNPKSKKEIEEEKNTKV